MLKLSLILSLCVLVAVGRYLSYPENCIRSPNNLFDHKYDIVTPEDVKQNVEGDEWLLIYYYSNNSPRQIYGKCIYKLNAPDINTNTSRRHLMCYNVINGECEDVEQNIESTVDECGRVKEFGVNIGFVAKYYSQDIDEYFWHYMCYDYDDIGECKVSHLGLLVRGSRSLENGTLDLQGLPLHKVVADLKINFDLDISDDRVKFNWKGPECGLDWKQGWFGEQIIL